MHIYIYILYILKPPFKESPSIKCRAHVRYGRALVQGWSDQLYRAEDKRKVQDDESLKRSDQENGPEQSHEKWISDFQVAKGNQATSGKESHLNRETGLVCFFKQRQVPFLLPYPLNIVSSLFWHTLFFKDILNTHFKQVIFVHIQRREWETLIMYNNVLLLSKYILTTMKQ